MSITETATIACGQLEYSVFGATYPDTECTSDGLVDLDGPTLRDDMCCPLCDPEGFFEYQWGGGYIEPTCSVCLARLPVSSVKFIDGQTLTWTVDCPKCEATQPGLMRDYDPEEN